MNYACFATLLQLKVIYILINYGGTNYSGEYGMPDYIGNSTWKLAKAGYNGTTDWLIGSATATNTVSASKSFATNQDLASDLGVLSDFETNATTTVYLYAKWVACEKGTYRNSELKRYYGESVSCNNCVAGTYQNETGKTSCKSCPSGYSSSVKATAENQCFISVPTGISAPQPPTK